MMSDTNEEWRSIVGWEGLYEASSIGRVRSLRTAHVLAPYESEGYLKVALHRADRSRVRTGVHRLVCLAFHGPAPAGHVAAHGDGQKQNNAASNLRWATAKENSADMMRHGRHRHGMTYGLARSKGGNNLTVQDIAEIRAASGISLEDLAKTYGRHMNTIWKIRARQAYKNI